MTDAKTIPNVVITQLIRGRAEMNVLLIVSASVLIAIAAQIAVPLPFTPVPLTMQPLAVILVGVTLGSARGSAAAALYLLEGFAGMPVFAEGHAGVFWATAATAGFLWSYPLAAWVAGRVSERGWGSTTMRAIAGMLAALAVIYIGGWSWLSIAMGARGAFIAGVQPFVLADIIKVAIGAAMLPHMQRLVRHL